MGLLNKRGDFPQHRPSFYKNKKTVAKSVILRRVNAIRINKSTVTERVQKLLKWPQFDADLPVYRANATVET